MDVVDPLATEKQETKVMEIVRLISWFDKTNEELLGEYNIDHIDFEILKKVFIPRKEDPLMYNPYEITAKEAEELYPLLDNFIFNFKEFIYQLDCFEVI